MSKDTKATQDVVDEFVLQSHHSYGKVRRLLINHPDLINKRASWGETALAAARHAGQSDIEHFLISAGAPDHDDCCDGSCKAPIERLSKDAFAG